MAKEEINPYTVCGCGLPLCSGQHPSNPVPTASLQLLLSASARYGRICWLALRCRDTLDSFEEVAADFRHCVHYICSGVFELHPQLSVLQRVLTVRNCVESSDMWAEAALQSWLQLSSRNKVFDIAKGLHVWQLLSYLSTRSVEVLTEHLISDACMLQVRKATRGKVDQDQPAARNYLYRVVTSLPAKEQGKQENKADTGTPSESTSAGEKLQPETTLSAQYYPLLYSLCCASLMQVDLQWVQSAKLRLQFVRSVLSCNAPLCASDTEGFTLPRLQDCFLQVEHSMIILTHSLLGSDALYLSSLCAPILLSKACPKVDVPGAENAIVNDLEATLSQILLKMSDVYGSLIIRTEKNADKDLRYFAPFSQRFVSLVGIVLLNLLLRSGRNPRGVVSRWSGFLERIVAAALLPQRHSCFVSWFLKEVHFYSAAVSSFLHLCRDAPLPVYRLCSFFRSSLVLCMLTWTASFKLFALEEVPGWRNSAVVSYQKVRYRDSKY